MVYRDVERNKYFNRIKGVTSITEKRGIFFIFEFSCDMYKEGLVMFLHFEVLYHCITV